MNKDVKYLTPKRSVKEIHGTERRAASAQAVAELMFVKAAQEQQLDETTIADDANPLAAGNARVQQEGVDWAPVAVAVGAFVLVDGVAIAYVLRKRRRNRMM